MLLPTRGKYLCRPLERERQLPSGLWMPGKLNSRKNDTVCECIGVGDPAVLSCSTCHDKKICRSKCREKGRLQLMVARRGHLIHFKRAYGQFIRWEERRYIFLTNQDIIAVEAPTGEIKTVGSMVLIRMYYEEKMGSMYVPDQAKLYSGEQRGVVIAVGPSYPDKSLWPGDTVIYLRNEGYALKTYHTAEELYAVKEKWIYGKIN